MPDRSPLAPATRKKSRRPRLSFGLIAVLLVGLGVALAAGGKVALDHTNQTSFCISCHEMKRHNFAEYSHTIHAQNRTGVKAGCADCHVPHELPDLVVRKIGAANDLWQHLVGRIDTDASFEAHRLELAQRVWRRMKATDSRECRNCHDTTAMNAELQGKTALKQHRRIAAEGKTCIDCHFGIAHQEPAGGAAPSSVVAPGPSAGPGARL
jgi:cytochrome c-type protein NapC